MKKYLESITTGTRSEFWQKPPYFKEGTFRKSVVVRRYKIIQVKIEV